MKTLVGVLKFVVVDSIQGNRMREDVRRGWDIRECNEGFM